MAFVDFEPLAIQELRKITQQGACEFGLKTANRIIDEVERIGKRLKKHPKSGFPETLLEGRTHEYRSCTIRKRFKMPKAQISQGFHQEKKLKTGCLQKYATSH